MLLLRAVKSNCIYLHYQQKYQQILFLGLQINRVNATINAIKD